MNLFKYRKFLIFILILIFVFIFTILSLSVGNNSLSLIKKIVPDNIKTPLKNTLFYLPKIINDNKSMSLELETSRLMNEFYILNKISNLEKISNENINYNDKKIQFNIIKWELPFWSSDINNGKSVAYIHDYNDEIYLITGNGKILSFNPLNNINEKLSPKIINSNIKKLIDDEYFYSNNKHSWISIKDMHIDDSKIYISFTKSKNDKKCYNTEIIVGYLSNTYIEFENFFSYEDCNYLANQFSTKSNEAFNAHQSGGRIINYKENYILFSTGEFRKREEAQNQNSYLGKIIKINKNTKKSSIFSSGHRNPQGLLYLDHKDIVLSSEHGPLGGDELNNIKEFKNYGWPISSYGEHYGYKTDTGDENYGIWEKDIYSFYPLHKSHKKYGFEEPIHYFSPSIGISEIIMVPPKFSSILSNNLFVTSLHGKGNGLSIFDIEFDENYENIIEINKIYIGERIRDIIYNETTNSFFMVLENSPAIAQLKINK